MRSSTSTSGWRLPSWFFINTDESMQISSVILLDPVIHFRDVFLFNFISVPHILHALQLNCEHMSSDIRTIKQLELCCYHVYNLKTSIESYSLQVTGHSPSWIPHLSRHILNVNRVDEANMDKFVMLCVVKLILYCAISVINLLF